MKKVFKKIIACGIMGLTLSLTSCALSDANVYNYWKVNDTEYLSKDHIVEKVKAKKVEKMVSKQTEDSDYIYVFYGQTDSTSSQSAIQVYNEQAIQYEIDTLYWVDSNLSTKKKDEAETKLRMSDSNNIPTLIVYKNGSVEFDSSRPTYKNNSKFTNYIIAEVAFKHLYDSNGDYSLK